MSPSRESRIAKDKVKNQIKHKFGSLYPVSSRRKDWIVNPTGELSFYITYSKAEQLFYDINPNDLDDMLGYDEAYVVFVLGSPDDFLMIPAKKMKLITKDLRLGGRGDYKLHIVDRSGKYAFREATHIDISGYLNNLDLNSTPEVRREMKF